MEYVLTSRKKFKKVIVVAHNGQAFDHQFVLNYVLNETHVKPELIMRGSKILMMMMAIGNVKFIDSLNFFPMALSALPKALGLGEELKKGYFPHLFNTEENASYVDLFLKWYDEHKQDVFDMQRDLVEYCRSDVDILKRACMKFREMFINECDVDPFTESITIASACNLMFRRKFLQPDTTGVIPKGGYRRADNQSLVVIQWFVWEEDR
ncbi:hypothetical protein RI129_002862 [Pyrocoelia pectoralis]|uniref:DNA-directed DNA polymerase n=1 Tax=Pyrocoelia pectoralis TaxID=417401 RepID=A0AAN7VGS9_9COLE